MDLLYDVLLRMVVILLCLFGLRSVWCVCVTLCWG